MDWIWGITIISNFIFTITLFAVGWYKRLRITSIGYIILLYLYIWQIWAYYSPSVSPQRYEDSWISIDGISIIVGIAILIEWSNSTLPKLINLSCIPLWFHLMLIVLEYGDDVHNEAGWIRVRLNIVLTLYLSLVLFLTRKEYKNVRT